MTKTLEEGLERSARKKGLSGKERQRYVGGAIRNMEKRGEFTIKRRHAAPKTHHKIDTRGKTSVQPSPARKPYAKPTITHKPAPAPKKTYSKPTITKKAPEKPREKLELEVKKNNSLSTPTKTIYSIYNKKTGARHGSFASSKRTGAMQEAKFEMDAYNHPKGVHTRNKLA